MACFRGGGDCRLHLLAPSIQDVFLNNAYHREITVLDINVNRFYRLSLIFRDEVEIRVRLHLAGYYDLWRHGQPRYLHSCQGKDDQLACNPAGHTDGKRRCRGGFRHAVLGRL